MIAPTAAERALYADLTKLMMRMKGETLALVEAAIEERFQEFVRANHPGRTSRLEITQTYIMHDDAEPWAEYLTEYRIAAAPSSDAGSVKAPAPAAAALPAPGIEARGNVVPFSRAFAGARAAQRQAHEAARPNGV